MKRLEQNVRGPACYQPLPKSGLSLNFFLSEGITELSAHNIPHPRLDAEVLLAFVLNISRSALYARLRESCPPDAVAAFKQLVKRRTLHEPLQYITRVQEFWSLEFKVDRRVLIPRPETELVVEIALEKISGPRSAPLILDVGTGSGCIAVALAKELPQAEVWATDISEDAVAVARKNARLHSVAERIRLHHGDLFAPVVRPKEGFDLIVSNPPYIARDDLAVLQLEVRDWEPFTALDGGTDGLDFYRRLVRDAPAYMRPGGWLILEIGHEQREDVLHLLRAHRDLNAADCVPDYAGRDRVMVACKTTLIL